MKQKLILYFTCILFKRNNQTNKQTNEQTNEQTSLLHNTTVCLQNNYCGFECTNNNLGNQTHVGLITKLYFCRQRGLVVKALD